MFMHVKRTCLFEKCINQNLALSAMLFDIIELNKAWETRNAWET